jgi:hypothetical protein
MCKSAIAVLSLMSLTLSTVAYADSASTPDPNMVRIEAISLNKTDEILEVRYSIHNGLRQDIWLCEQVSDLHDFEVYLAKDTRTLMIRRRFDVRSSILWSSPPRGSYVRIKGGQNRLESLALTLPIWSVPIFATEWISSQEVRNARQLVIEIAYYSDASPEKPIGSKDGDDRIVVRRDYGELSESAEVLRLTFDNQVIPYIPYVWSPDVGRLLKLTSSTLLDVRYEPSMLDYFYPLAEQQTLFSEAEKKHLGSQTLAHVSDPALVEAVAGDVRRGSRALAVCAGPTAQMIFYDTNQLAQTFTLFGDRTLLTSDKRTFKYVNGISSLRIVTPQIQPFELRTQCARNLINLMSRVSYLRVSGKEGLPSSLGRSQWAYPQVERWSDVVVEAWPKVKAETLLPMFKCPGVTEGKCHYAMNPNCEPNSPPDMVLLFETKAGWNQHGGPELFTFDNHDPKGGCILLNDGTVKFIRTKEELAQLRWKP